ncbi:DUF4249 domain-containing protein [Flavobacterium sp. WV_118_3]|uniref:DUF4249 domain-containing protein n=1 Tax=Flavobacterium sp. WV_118_3 TaxID=3151764 RepID=UPI00321BE2AA
MKTKFVTQLVFLLLIGFGLTNCTDPYKMKTDTFEDAVVIEATITNILEKQTVKVFRTYRFEDFGPVFEENADVTITDSDGNEYPFAESNRTYTSVNAFQAVPGKQYQLTVITSDGKKYVSTKEILPPDNPLEDVTANVTTIDNIRGVEIRAKSPDPNNASQFYRYEYEESYKVIAPRWLTVKAFVHGPSLYELEITMVPRTEEARICYSTDKSTEILLFDKGKTIENSVDFPVRFISNQNYIMSHRYTILVRQYVQNLHAYNYYKNLKKISDGGTIFSPNQPGYLRGNITSVNNPNEKAIGFFDVSTVSSKRIFFNYADLFPGEALPPYKVDCYLTEFLYCYGGGLCSAPAVNSFLTNNLMTIYDFHNAPISYTLTPAACGDCTSFSSNIIPPFWVE